MLKDYLHKIRKVIDDSEKIVPYPYNTFYTCLAISVENMPPSSVTPNTVQSMATIYKFYRTHLGPGTDQIHLPKLHNQLTEYLLPFRKYIPNNQLFKSMTNHFDDINFLEQINSQIEKADQLIKQYKEKGNKIHVKGNHEIAYSFWVNNFKADYAVHFDIVWRELFAYLEKYEHFRNFVNQSSKWKIKNVLDHDRKYYVTSAHVNQLFLKMSQPAFLQELAEEASLKNKPEAFKSQSTLKLIFRKINKNAQSSMRLGVMSGSLSQSINTTQTNCNFPEEEILTINGQQIRCNLKNKFNVEAFNREQIVVQNKYTPTIRFGSSNDNQFCLKAPYISRRQFMIIQQSSYLNKTINLADIDEAPEFQSKFSMVCLSPTNYTEVIYGRRVQAKVGMIFRVDEELIEITNICEQFQGIKQGDESLKLFTTISEEEPTLSYLPHQKSLNTIQTLTYMFLNGKKRNIKESCSSESRKITLSSGMNFNFSYADNKFYLPADIQIKAKNSNQILSGHMSDKIGLESKMKIRLEGFQLEILEIDENSL